LVANAAVDVQFLNLRRYPFLMQPTIAGSRRWLYETYILEVRTRSLNCVFSHHRWSDKFTSAVGYLLVNIDNTEAQTPQAFRRLSDPIFIHV
jgi:hypothetical protein